MITRKTQRGVLLLVVLTGASFWNSRMKDSDDLRPVAGLDPELNYVLRDFEIQFFDEDGQATVNMRSPLLRNNPELQIGTIEQPVVLFNQPGVVWQMKADSATMTADKEHVVLSGQVHFQRDEQTTGKRVELETREVHVEITPKTASTDESVKIFDGRNQLNGRGLELDMMRDTFSLKQQVEASYAVN